MSKIFTVTEKIRGTEYTAQFNGVEAYTEAIDSCYIEDSGNISTEKMAKYIFKNVIVKPNNIDINDFGKDKIGTQETTEIGGVKYTAQFNGVLAAIRATDGSYIDGESNTSLNKLGKYILKNVIVEPSDVTLDDFDSVDDYNELLKFGSKVMGGGDAMKEFNEVIAFGRKVMAGQFRERANKPSTKKESKA